MATDAAYHTVYTVPSGRVAVVRGLVLTNGQSGSNYGPAKLSLNGAAGTYTDHCVWAVPSLSTMTTYSFPTQMVLSPGDHIELQLANVSPAVNLTVTGFGSLLVGAPI